MEKTVTEQAVEQTQEQQRVESDAAFAAGHAEARGEPPAKPEPKEPEAKTEEAPAKEEAKPQGQAEAKADDPFAGVKAELESMRTKLGVVDQLDHRFKSFEGRIHKIGSAVEALAAAKAAASTVAEAPSQAQMKEAIADPVKWKQAKEDFPDWAEAVEERLAQERAALPQPQTVDVNGIKTQITSDVAPLIEAAKAQARDEARVLALVDAKHEGWEETIQTPEFEAWFQKQAPDVQALARSPKARDAIRMLDAYAEDKKKADAERLKKEQQAERLARATTPKGVPAQPSTLNDADAFESGYKSVRGG